MKPASDQREERAGKFVGFEWRGAGTPTPVVEDEDDDSPDTREVHDTDDTFQGFHWEEGQPPTPVTDGGTTPDDAPKYPVTYRLWDQLSGPLLGIAGYCLVMAGVVLAAAPERVPISEPLPYTTLGVLLAITGVVAMVASGVRLHRAAKRRREAAR